MRAPIRRVRHSSATAASVIASTNIILSYLILLPHPYYITACCTIKITGSPTAFSLDRQYNKEWTWCIVSKQAECRQNRCYGRTHHSAYPGSKEKQHAT